MRKQVIRRLTKNFEEYAQKKENVEYWYARDLQRLLGYKQWRNFLKVIDKAKESVEKSGNKKMDHFADVSKKVKCPSNKQILKNI